MTDTIQCNVLKRCACARARTYTYICIYKGKVVLVLFLTESFPVCGILEVYE